VNVSNCTSRTIIQSVPNSIGEVIVENCLFDGLFSVVSDNFKVFSSRFIHKLANPNVASQFRGEYNNCIISDTLADSTVGDFNNYDGAFNSCTITGMGGAVSASNGMTITTRARFNNCRIKDFLGRSAVAYSAITSSTKENFYNCIIENCAFLFPNNNAYDSTNADLRTVIFKNCQIKLGFNSKQKFVNCKFYDCTTLNNTKSLVEMISCVFENLTGTHIFEGATKVLKHSDIRLQNIAGSSNFTSAGVYNHKIYNTVIKTTETILASQLTTANLYNCLIDNPVNTQADIDAIATAKNCYVINTVAS
jgi:hypothetical protein